VNAKSVRDVFRAGGGAPSLATNKEYHSPCHSQQKQRQEEQTKGANFSCVLGPKPQIESAARTQTHADCNKTNSPVTHARNCKILELKTCVALFDCSTGVRSPPNYLFKCFLFRTSFEK
jgi:hypothetical protein